MAPTIHVVDAFDVLIGRSVKAQVMKPTDPAGLTLEAWAEGYMIGSLIILSCITLANMRRGVLLHKLILLELVLGYWQGFFILFNPPIYAWWLSAAAIPLNMSWSLHNVISWMKIKPFLSRRWSLVFIGTVILVQPYWVVEIYANFTYFHNVNDVFLKTRPFEALCRDPWWIITTIVLFWNVKTRYDLSIPQIVRISPRFAVMLGAMLLSIAFIVLDVLSVTSVLGNSLPVGINPFWKLSFVFKCLTDAVVLDDFKTALDRLRAFKMTRLGSFAGDAQDRRHIEHANAVADANAWADPSTNGFASPVPALPSPDGDYIKTQPGWEPIKGGAQHIDRPSFASLNLTRGPSRDRDPEENDVEALDHMPMAVPMPHRRENSDSRILENQDSFLRTSTSTGRSELQLEYAKAVREVTPDMADHSRGSKM